MFACLQSTFNFLPWAWTQSETGMKIFIFIHKWYAFTPCTNRETTCIPFVYNKIKLKKINTWAKELNRHFTEDIQLINKYMEKCSKSPAIIVMQIKTTLRFHLTPIRMAIIKNTSNNKSWWGCEEKIHSYIACGNSYWCNHYEKW